MEIDIGACLKDFLQRNVIYVCENMLSTVHANVVIGLGTNEVWLLLSNSIKVNSNRLALSYQLSTSMVYFDLYLTVKAYHIGTNINCIL